MLYFLLNFVRSNNNKYMKKICNYLISLYTGNGDLMSQFFVF